MWVLIIIHHGSLLNHSLPGYFCSFAIPVSLLISSVYGRVVKEENRRAWTLKLPGQLIMLVAFSLIVEFIDDFQKNFSEGADVGVAQIVVFLYVRFAFWICLAVKATDVSQVVLPMFMLVRPFHCTALICALICTSRLRRG